MNEKNLEVKPTQTDLIEGAANSIHSKTIFSDHFFKFLTVIFELALIVATIYLFQLERDHGFLRLLPSLFFGFIIYNLLPLKFRLPFLFILSVFTFIFIIGFWNTLLLMAIGSGLILICHLPIAYSKRIVLILLAGALLAAIRVNWIVTSWGSVILPIIGSMFMFRLILYIYELGQKDQEPANIWQRLCYFFLLPNVCFPLFPIVDYKTYVRSYFNADPIKIFQKGINWMFRGVTQLILYRIIYFFWVPSPVDVVDIGSLTVYLLTAYLLLLKISGQAHLIIGILCLFGFDLPQIFNKYFLANGFNDFWRRINIYWKDFVMKIFYYRVFFVFRKWDLRISTTITLLFIFLVTWLLHSYQYFWLQGTFPITRVDGIFWGIFGVLVAANSLVQIKYRSRKSLGSQKLRFVDAFKRSFQVISFFTFMCILWSFWQSDSIPEWISTVSAVKNTTLSEIGLIVLVLVSAIFVGAVIQYPFSKLQNLSLFRKQSFYGAALVIIVVASAILGFRLYEYSTLEETKLVKFIHSIKEPRLNEWDAEMGERGYYEPLLSSRKLTAQSYKGVDLRPPDWHVLSETDIVRSTNDLLLKELAPDKSLTWKGIRFSTNKWGMRDKDYELRKPPGTYRFAVLGVSIEMGSGVANHEVFEWLLEERLNKNNKNEVYSNYEILNFSVGQYDLVKHVKVTDTKLFKFEPDATIYFAHTRETWRAVDRLKGILNSGLDLEYDFLKGIMKRAGIKRGMNDVEVMKRLFPYADDILHWGYSMIAEKCRQNHSVPVWVFLPTVEGEIQRQEVDQLIHMAKELGFVTIDLSDVYDNYNPESLVVSPWDDHPNILGHRLIADLLYKKIMENRDSLHLGNRSVAKIPETK